jgi:hypothetical protein
MYSTIGSGPVSQATPQGRHHKRAEVGFELAIKRLPFRFVSRVIPFNSIIFLGQTFSELESSPLFK